jgi:hypothetical protein
MRFQYVVEKMSALKMMLALYLNEGQFILPVRYPSDF